MTEFIRKESSVELAALPPNPRNLPLSGQNGCFGSTTIEALERRIGLRRNATRAPTQAREWRGRLRPPPDIKSDPPIHNLLRPKNGLDKGATFGLRLLRREPELLTPAGDGGSGSLISRPSPLDADFRPTGKRGGIRSTRETPPYSLYSTTHPG